MGQHFVQIYFLKSFALDGLIWVVDKEKRTVLPSQPKSIANENSLYSDTTEKNLNVEIERPAEPLIDKVRNKQHLTESDRAVLAQYISTQLIRTPEAKKRISEGMPEVAEAVRGEIHKKLDREQISDSERMNVKVRVNEIFETKSYKQPPMLWDKVVAHPISDDLLDSLLSMQWSFFVTTDCFFLTGDNPVFIFKSQGIREATSELVWPISPNVCLFAHRQQHGANQYFEVQPSIVRQVNGRISSNATRFVFSSTNEEWLQRFVCKDLFYLNRLSVPSNQNAAFEK